MPLQIILTLVEFIMDVKKDLIEQNIRREMPV